MNEECCGSREEGQANDIPATLVAVYNIIQSLKIVLISANSGHPDEILHLAALHLGLY